MVESTANFGAAVALRQYGGILPAVEFSEHGGGGILWVDDKHGACVLSTLLEGGECGFKTKKEEFEKKDFFVTNG